MDRKTITGKLVQNSYGDPIFKGEGFSIKFNLNGGGSVPYTIESNQFVPAVVEVSANQLDVSDSLSDYEVLQEQIELEIITGFDSAFVVANMEAESIGYDEIYLHDPDYETIHHAQWVTGEPSKLVRNLKTRESTRKENINTLLEQMTHLLKVNPP